MNLYKWFYSRLGGRPWTYIRRDFWHKFELVNIVFFVSIGFFSGFYFPRIWMWIGDAWWKLVVMVAIFYFIGVIQGHFFWGSKYIEGQDET